MKLKREIYKKLPSVSLNTYIFYVLMLAALSLILPGLGFAAGPVSPGKPSTQPEYSTDQVLVKFKKPFLQGARDLKANKKSPAAADLTLQLSGFGVKFSKHFNNTGISVLKVTDSTFPLRKEVLMRLNRSGLVEYAEPDYAVHANSHAQDIPNDSMFNDLWGMNNTGQTGGTSNADIDAVEAWAHQTGDPNTIAVVLDTGVDFTHEDLAGNMWVNTNETPNNGVDDDGNGYIDDIHGIDTINGDTNPMDDHGHGTHVSGTMGAVGNNSIGVVGVSRNIKIMACKFLNAAGNGSMSGAIECLDYIQDMKLNHGWPSIRLSNNSWGCVDCFSQALMDAIEAQGDNGIMFVASSGNLGINTDITDHYPSGYDLDNIISVAATDHNDQMAGFSDFGVVSVDLGAPGVSITSTIPGNNYAGGDVCSGTSMAAPHVSGAVALAWATFPTASFQGIKNLILNTTDKLANLDGLMASGGRLNVHNAVTCVPGNPDMVLLKPGSGFNVVIGTKVIVSASLSDCANLVTDATVDVTPSNGDGVFPLRDDGVGADKVAGDGTYTAEWYPGSTGDVTLAVAADVDGTLLNDSVTGSVTKDFIADDQAPYNWVNARNLGTFVGLNDFFEHDDAFVSMPIGFDFEFYGQVYNTVYISSNGFLTFNSAGATFFNNTRLPDPSNPNALIAPLWDDICPVTDDGVWSLMEGTAPNRKLTIEWHSFGPWPCVGNAIFEVTLFEGSNDIKFQYQNVDLGGSFGTGADGGAAATVGLEDEVGGKGVEYSYNTASLSSGQAIHFHLPQFSDHSLTLTHGPSGGPNPVAPGGQVQMVANAVDSSGHTILFNWSASCPTLGSDGSFDNANAQNPVWTSPANDSGSIQECTITVLVDDQNGLTDSRSYTQSVDFGSTPPPPPHTLNITTPPSGNPNPVDSGATAALSVVATDSEGHPINYNWSADCSSWIGVDGIFSFPNPSDEAHPNWQAPVNDTGSVQTCTITVDVDNGSFGLSDSDSYNHDVNPVPGLPGELAVTPTDGLEFSGPKGGPYNPASDSFQVSNVGDQSVDFTVSADQNWVGLSSSSGTLAPGASQTINVSITSRANKLKNGTYNSTVNFVNTTNGQGNTNRTVTLNIGDGGGEPPPPSGGGLVVTPDSDFSVGGKSGSFGSQATVYTMTNLGNQPIGFSVNKLNNAPWVDVIVSEGTTVDNQIDPNEGESVTVTVLINGEANNLSGGRYEEVIEFVNELTHEGDTTRTVKLHVRGN